MWPFGSLNFHFREIIVLSTGGSTCSSGTKTSRSTEHEIRGKGRKKLLVG